MEFQQYRISESSTLATPILYNSKEKVLQVTFLKNEKKYRYHNVPEDVVKKMLLTTNPGSFFQKNIARNNDYKYEQIK